MLASICFYHALTDPSKSIREQSEPYGEQQFSSELSDAENDEPVFEVAESNFLLRGIIAEGGDLRSFSRDYQGIRLIGRTSRSGRGGGRRSCRKFKADSAG